tara:strand:+ start:3066 stop:5477 length:2412 start_codon:yes stop_codon:yes gene_type:complete
MWSAIAKFIIRQRIAILILLAIVTVLMGIKSRDARLQWGLPKLLPDHDSALIVHEEFKERFGEAPTTFLLGIEENPLENLELFNQWYQMGEDLDTIQGVSNILSINHLFNIEKNQEEKKFELDTIVTRQLTSEAELDSVRNKILSLPFYKGTLYNDTSMVNIMTVTLNNDKFNSKQREPLVDAVLNRIEQFEEETGVDVSYSGLPFIRTFTTRLIKSELKMFIVLAFVVTISILFLFFRSIYPVMVSILIVALGVVWSIGSLALLDYEMTILTSIIPPLIIVIGIPNAVYLINKYHSEYLIHKNKPLALIRVVTKIGKATLLTNFTTAIGFLTFIFTDSQVLVEFGIVASINIMLLFIISILIIPTVFSFLPPPEEKHTKHLDKAWVMKTVGVLENLATNYRKWTYVGTAILVLLGLNGLRYIRTTGNLVDDLPKSHFVVEDLHFFEKNFNGVMPLEIEIDAKKPRQVTRSSTLRRLDQLEHVLGEYPEMSKPLSIVDGIKYIRQAYYGGSPSMYKLISRQEEVFFKPYVENANADNGVLDRFVDSTKQYARVSVRVADVGTQQMDSLLTDLRPKVEKLFPTDKYTVNFTGTSVTYLKGTTYLVHNLFTSLFLAIMIIALIMALLFSSLRMIAMSIFTNMIPLLLTAAMMGYFGIPLKPSTILVFSIAFGISIDDTIHFLAKYRMELKNHNWNIGVAAITAIHETGVSMIYTSIILFCGFSVFDISDFGGTKALGILVSFTLLIAMLSNLVLLPSFLMTMDNAVTTKAFREPLLDVFDEEEDIEFDDLTIRKTREEQSSLEET